jgi:hypothetical protein
LDGTWNCIDLPNDREELITLPSASRIWADTGAPAGSLITNS